MGPNCDFLHEYNLAKMPECVHYSQTGQCDQDDIGECVFLHVDAQSKVKVVAECDDYSQIGFCPDGPRCLRRHVRKVACDKYLAGFCPLGPQCENAHPKFSVVRSQNGRFKIKLDKDIIQARLERLRQSQQEAGAVDEKSPAQEGLAAL